MISQWDFPGGPVVKNLHSNAGGIGLIPVWGTKIPSAITTEPTCSRAHIPQLRPDTAK